jgi:hypothetical protein
MFISSNFLQRPMLLCRKNKRNLQHVSTTCMRISFPRDRNFAGGGSRLLVPANLLLPPAVPNSGRATTDRYSDASHSDSGWPSERRLFARSPSYLTMVGQGRRSAGSVKLALTASLTQILIGFSEFSVSVESSTPDVMLLFLSEFGIAGF